MTILFENKKECLSATAFDVPRLNSFRISIENCVMADFENWVELFPIHIWEDCGTEYTCFLTNKQEN